MDGAFQLFRKAEQFVAASSIQLPAMTGDPTTSSRSIARCCRRRRATAHGPNDCSATLGSSPCPPPSPSRNRGSVIRHMHDRPSEREYSAPYFQTLGGSISTGRAESAYQDYRFQTRRVALRETLEHYIYGIVGLSVVGEQGTVGAGRRAEVPRPQAHSVPRARASGSTAARGHVIRMGTRRAPPHRGQNKLPAVVAYRCSD